MSEGRRYFNLAGVVRDLEHASGPEATSEGRELWARFGDVIEQAIALAASLDADDDAEDQDWSDDEHGVQVGHEGRPDGGLADGGLGGLADRIDLLLSRLTGMAPALADQQGPEGEVPSGTPAVDGAGRRPGLDKRLTAQPVTVEKGAKRGKKSTTRKRS